MGKIVEVKFNAIVEDDFVEEFEKIVDHKLDTFLNLEEFPEIGSVYYARTKVLGDNTVGEVLASYPYKEEDNKDNTTSNKKVDYKEESKDTKKENKDNKSVNKMFDDFIDLFAGSYNEKEEEKDEEKKSNLKLIANEKYVIDFINGGNEIGYEAFNKIYSEFGKIVKEEESFSTVSYATADRRNYTITLYRANQLSAFGVSAGGKDMVYDIENHLVNIMKDFANVKYMIDVTECYIYKKY